MGGMSTEPFKFDLLAVYEVIAEAPGPEWATDHAMKELSRQLHTAGAPDAPLEQQLGALLADHIAMRAAGAEMPSEAMVADRVYEQCGNNEAAINAASRVLDLFRPLFARLTQERDEAREEAGRWFRARQSDNVRHVAECAALRQRAERAEADCAEMKTKVRDVLAMVEPVRESFRDALADNERQRARIADLEAQLAARRVEPGADVVERLTCVYLKALNAPVTQDMVELPSPRTAMAAVLSALAEMGEEALPSSLDILATVSQGGAIAHGVHAMLRAKVSPVLGALRARVAEFEGVATERDEYRAQIEEHVEEAQRLKNRLAALEAESSHHQATVAALREASKPWATRKFLEGLRDRADEPLKSAIAELLEVGK
jgi:septal ring factor EnvC (AmiA/AmiB activator)